MSPFDPLATTALKTRIPRWALRTADLSFRMVAETTAGDRRGPDFLVVGAKRGGTTSLFNYLIQHPGILGTYPRPRAKKSTKFFFADNPHSLRWYRSNFHSETYRRTLRRRLGYRPLGFEASPYYIWDPRIAQRVHRFSPDLKAIVLLRDPTRRAWSHYQERVQNGVEPLTFAQALEVEDDRLEGELEHMLTDPAYHSTAHDWYSYRTRGEYLTQIENWNSFFPREQLLVVRSEDLYTRTQETIDQICSFLEIPAFQPSANGPFNATWRTTDQVPATEAQLLRSHFSTHNEALGDYLGRPMGWPPAS